MSRASSRIPLKLASLPAGYLDLLAEFPLRPIRSAAEYDRAAKIVHRLAMRQDRLDAGQRSYLEVLETLLERFDRARSPHYGEDVTPSQALGALVRQANMSVTDLGRLLGSKSAASELLSGKRKEPSKAQIVRLAVWFKVDPGLFLLPMKSKADAA